MSCNVTIVDISFDRLPSAKGAAVHIGAFARALGKEFGDVRLITVADPECREIKEWPGVHHRPISVLGANMIERALFFRSRIRAMLKNGDFSASGQLIFHVRSIYEGYALVGHLPPNAKLVYEVNGLPSIELKYHYPDVSDDPDFMRKLIAQEERLLGAADLVLTPSEVTRNYLIERGAPAERIEVIANGVDVDFFPYQPVRKMPVPPQKLEVLYSGTLSSWQGVDVAIEAVRLYRRDAPARLTVVGPARNKRRRELLALGERAQLGDDLTLLSPVSQPELAALHHGADAVLAPLLPNDRNKTQGCCPLKVLEAMASGTPLVASDLEVVSLLARNEEEALLVRPGSAKAIKDALVRLVSERELGARLSRTARKRVEEQFTWSHAQSSLVRCYSELLGGNLSEDSSRASRRDIVSRSCLSP